MARRYEFYVRVAREISHEFAVPTREIVVALDKVLCFVIQITFEGGAPKYGRRQSSMDF